MRGDDLSEHMSRYLADHIDRIPRRGAARTPRCASCAATRRWRRSPWRDGRTGERSGSPARALFVFIGARPCTGWLGGLVALDGDGFVRTGPDTGRAAAAALLETSLPGVFAVGDVRSGSVKRVASAVGEGAMAIRLAFERTRPG